MDSRKSLVTGTGSKYSIDPRTNSGRETGPAEKEGVKKKVAH